MFQEIQDDVTRLFDRLYDLLSADVLEAGPDPKGGARVNG